jgi:uncharacterized protein (TIGR00369 family)
VCSPHNPRGLHLQFDADKDGLVVARWLPHEDFVSYPGIVHGGIIVAVLDEAMSQAVARCGQPGFTCELEVRMRRHVRIGVPMCVRGWVVEKRKRRVVAQARLTSTSGEEHARARGTFLEAPAPARAG